MYAKFMPIFAVESFVLFSFTGDYLNLEMFKNPAFGRSGCRLFNSTVIFLPDISDVWRWPNPVKTLKKCLFLHDI
jgi:hypothetical protein